MCPYARLTGAALNGEHWLFAQQDTVEVAWRVVDRCSGTWSRSTRTPGKAGARTRPGPQLPEGETWFDPAAS